MARERVHSNPEKKLGLRQRRDKANELFSKGWGVLEVAEELGVNESTALRYHRVYKDRIRTEAATNPHLLREVLPNVVEAIEGLKRVQAEAWKRADKTDSDSVRSQMLNLVVKAQTEIDKLLGLVGVKQDVLAYTMAVQKQHANLIEFMKKHLCPACRTKLEEYVVQEFKAELEAAPTATGVDR